jgi:hypothetical protein
LLASFVGQAAAVITLAGVLIYGAGALTLALRLAFSRLPWESVLAQLPHDLLLTTGFGQVILPASITGMLGAILLDFLINGKGNDKGVTRYLRKKLTLYSQQEPGIRHFFSWAIGSIVIGAVEAGIFFGIYIYHETGFSDYGVVVPAWLAFLYVLAISVLAAGVAVIIFPPSSVVADPVASGAERTAPDAGRRAKLTPWEWRVLAGVLVTFTVVPLWSAISASTLFPYAIECSSDFAGGVHSGNLIGINGGWAYMTEYRARTSKHGHLIYDHPYFSVVPLSSIQLLATGNSNYVNGECANWLAKTPAKP